MTIKEAALAYAAEGWPVLPLYTARDGLCGCGNLECKSPGKHPVPEYAPQGVHSATLDLQVIAAWPEPINVGVALGAVAGDLMVFDIDDTDTARALLHPQLGLSDRMGVSATGRGAHVWFRTSGSTRGYLLREAREDKKKLGEMRGDGLYVVAPPSEHVSGRSYRWLGLPAGTYTRPLPLMGDSFEFIAALLDEVGVPVDTDREALAGVDVPDTAVTACDLPEVLAATGHLTDVLQALKGTVEGGSDPDRSGRLYGMAWRIYYESLVVEQEIDAGTLAGVVKRIDEQCYHKYTDRRDADRYYLMIAMKVAREREHMAPRAQRSRNTATAVPAATPDGQTAPSTGAQQPTSQQTYVWDAQDGLLLLKRGRDWPRVCNFYPRILADVEIDRSGEVTRAWQVQFTLKDGRYIEFFLPSEDRPGWRLPEAFSKALPADYNVYSGMYDHVRTAMQELSAGQWENKREFASSGWVTYGADRVYLLPSAAGGIGPSGLDSSIRINVDHLPEGEPITSPALANYGRGVRPPASDEEKEQAWEAFRSLVVCGPPDLTMGIALQVLAGPLRSAGVEETPPLIHVLGRTGSLKTSFCNVALSMFGTFDESAPPPANWWSTPNSLQTMLHTTKDLTLLIDDFKASAVRSRGGVVQLIQQYADGTVRQRQNLQQQLQRTQVPRGLILSNGEDVWEREASAEARTITIQVRAGDIDTEALTLAQAAVLRGEMQIFGGLYLQWLARHPEIFEDRVVSALRTEWRQRLQQEARGLTIHLRLLSTVATLGAVGQVFYRFIGEEFPEHQETVREWVATTARTLSTGARRRGAEVEESSPFRQLARELIEAMAARKVCFWPAAGISEQRPRLPDIANTEIIGYYSGNGTTEEPYVVLLTRSTTYAWYQQTLRQRSEQPGFVWTAVRNEIEGYYGGAQRRRLRVVTKPGGDVRQLNGVEVALSELERAAGQVAAVSEQQDAGTEAGT